MKTTNMPEGVIAKYLCGICRSSYDSIEKAQACFSEGEAKPVLKAGTILALNGAQNMAFVVVKFNRWPSNPHIGSYMLWGFRDTGAGDNTGTDYCGDSFTAVCDLITDKINRYYSNAELRLQSKANIVNRGSAAYRRAVKMCRINKFTPVYWDGEKLKPHKRYMSQK